MLSYTNALNFPCVSAWESGNFHYPKMRVEERKKEENINQFKASDDENQSK